MINNIRGLKILSQYHPDIQKLLNSNTDAPEIHGDKVWFSSYFIIDYLIKNPPAQHDNIMEIGCGWGILAIYCVKYFKANTIAVDADKYVFPFLDLHAKENQVTLESLECRYEKLTIKILAQQDLIIGADICFWKELVKPLYTMIKRAIRKKGMRIIIADPGRSPFFKLAKICKKEFDAELIAVDITDPSAESGYLLVINRA